jgi:hypothetical protein
MNPSGAPLTPNARFLIHNSGNAGLCSGLIPESCMKINEKNLGHKEKYPVGKKDVGGFYLINFHPLGESEAFICCVAKGSK